MALAILNNTLKHTNLSLTGKTVMFNKIGLVMATLMAAYTTPALANWGDNWGEMAWGAPTAANVPMMGGLGMALLALALVAMAVKGLRSHSTLGLLLLVGVVGAVNNVEAQVTIPNTFTNGEVADAAEVNANFSALADALDVTVPSSFANSGIADANEVNSNFDVLKTAVDTFTNDLAAATSATETAFTNGSIQGAASVDITTDNAAIAAAAAQAACVEANGTWDSGTCTASSSADSCSAAAWCGYLAAQYPDDLPFYTNNYAPDAVTFRNCPPYRWLQELGIEGVTVYARLGTPEIISLITGEAVDGLEWLNAQCQ
ncbi:hypothetical protein N8793_01640 [Pseudomonadales bacterium]|nr:hypothetical protein [Pseudomonadales bacterium]